VSEPRRYFLELTFDGTPFHGWQIQPNAVTVQEILNKALSTLFRETIETVGCGRTDTGVHATQFFAHFDINSQPDSYRVPTPNSQLRTPNSQLPTPTPHLITSLNALLPYQIAVKRFIEVAPTAHALFDAAKRSYEYHIHFHKDPFKHNLSWLMHDRPDILLMNKAAQILMEYRDFSCFSKSNTQVFTNNCIISRAEWKDGPDLVFRISADRFLRNMVRAIVGTLLRIGSGELQPEDIRSVIESKNRSNAGVSVPACGLYLTEVVYPYIENEEKIEG
jgi:tRNA pseudouridine38-40 synthase